MFSLPINHPRVIFTSNRCHTHQICVRKWSPFLFRHRNSRSAHPNLPKVAIFGCKKCYFGPGWHNLRCYWWCQQILKSYQMHNHKFLRQSAVIVRFCGKNDVFPLRTIYLGIMYMDELYQMIIFALKHYDNWKDRTHLRKVDLAPSKNISSLSYTKSMGLSLSPPQLLLPSSLIPPALSSRCSCPQSLQPSQKGKGLPFHCTNWNCSAEKGSGDCNLCLLWSKLTSPPKLWPGNLHPGSGKVGDQGMGVGRDLSKSSDNKALHLSHWCKLPLHWPHLSIRSSTISLICCPRLGHITLVELIGSYIHCFSCLLSSPVRSIPGRTAAYNFDLVQAWDQVVLVPRFFFSINSGSILQLIKIANECVIELIMDVVLSWPMCGWVTWMWLSW